MQRSLDAADRTVKEISVHNNLSTTTRQQQNHVVNGPGRHTNAYHNYPTEGVHAVASHSSHATASTIKATESTPCNICCLNTFSDAVETLQQLRWCLEERGSAVLTVVDTDADILLDAFGIMHLCTQDLMLDGDVSNMVVFQPILADVRSLGAADPTTHDGNSTTALLVKKVKAPVVQSHDLASGLGHSAGSADQHHADGPAHPSTAPETLKLASHMIHDLTTHGSTRVTCQGPRGLVVALAAMKQTRAAVKMQGTYDILISLSITMERDAASIRFNCWRKKVPTSVHSGARTH